MSGKYERLSALMDGETNEFETRRLLQDVKSDKELTDTWRRYHLARSLMREQRIESSIDISSSVMAELDSGSASTGVVQSKEHSFWKASASMAVAASVTFAVLLGVQNFSATDTRLSPLDQAGLIDRNVSRSGLLPTSLSSVESTGQSVGETIEVIRLSEDLKSVIEQHQHAVATDAESDWSVGWLPLGYQPVGTQLGENRSMQIFDKDGTPLSVSIMPKQRVAAELGVYTEGAVLAYGAAVGSDYISVVGEISLTEAQQVLNSVSKTD